MKKIFAAFFALSLFACNSANTPVTAEATPFVPADMHGFSPQYSASFVMDSAANTETILALWRVWQDGDLSKGRQYFADSFTVFPYEGGMVQGATDDVLKGTQDFRNSFKTMNTAIDAIFAAKSTDRNEHWVTVWGSEIRSDSSGKTDSLTLQETWRLDSAGKVNLMFQYARQGVAPPPPIQQ
jgi:hypothetical protein